MYTLFDFASSFLPLYRAGRAVGPEETLERDVAGLEAIVQNLDEKRSPAASQSTDLRVVDMKPTALVTILIL